jgi:ergothioneine biosynthesis protein EgtB
MQLRESASSVDQHLELTDRFLAVRSFTESLASCVSAEDQTVQSMPDVSPTKWHRAHTTWFFESFLLVPSLPGYRVFHPDYAYLFNSYYEGVGAHYPRANRGIISRPGVQEVAEYRCHVDEAMVDLFDDVPSHLVLELAELGIQHEQQHQELLLMDIKHVLSRNPMQPAFDAIRAPEPDVSRTRTWTTYGGGNFDIGYGGERFSFDNELPRHRVYLEPFALADQLVTCGEWLDFIDDDGYQRPELWLVDGWATVQSERWCAPLYWAESDSGWREFTLGGPIPLNPAQPVCHLSYYEADAFARWAGFRMPTEAEWEVAATGVAVEGHFLDQTRLHPSPAIGSPVDGSQFGNVWQWTSSAYCPYPGFEPAKGAVGEYNGKFMVNQYVLRGGSCVTPAAHVRSSYRNFFPALARWAFSGLRLARGV